MEGKLNCMIFLWSENFSNSMACATAEFSQAVNTIFCKVLELMFLLNGSSLSNCNTLLANCAELRKSKIIPVSSVNTSRACGIGVEIIGQAQLIAYAKVPLTA